MMMEARERRKVEKPRLPRTAKKLDTSRMTREMGDLGVDVDVTGNVSIRFLCEALWCCGNAFASHGYGRDLSPGHCSLGSKGSKLF